ncbi:hypothetical protein [Nostoc sp.]|uniref:hypothetical protein n=1 Tax=Nostoc sp. TaxID=1180 RepID=UPI002FFBE777
MLSGGFCEKTTPNGKQVFDGSCKGAIATNQACCQNVQSVELDSKFRRCGLTIGIKGAFCRSRKW